MKQILYLALLLSLPFLGSAQQTITYSITVDAVQREFILYIPASYSGSTSVPLVFSFHGLGGNAQAQMEDHDFRPVADTAGFIVAHPLGAPILGPGLRGWNFGNDSLPNDVHFTSAMIDTLAAEFNIDLDRVYACGMSFGGFFSIYLAGQLSDRIAAIASVAGTILNNLPDSVVTPNRPMALLEIHGTNDNNVAYNGSQTSKPVQYVLDLFVRHNNCDTVPSIIPLPDTNPNDGSTVERIVYANGSQGTTVEHLKVNGGRHTWPNENTNAQGVNRDINGCVEIWKFFSRFDKNGAIAAPFSVTSFGIEPTIRLYPNPSKDDLLIHWKSPMEISIFSFSGQECKLPMNQTNYSCRIDVSSLSSGLYVIALTSGANIYTAKFMKK